MTATPDWRVFELSPFGHVYNKALDDGWKRPQAFYIAWRCVPKAMFKEANAPASLEALAEFLGYKDSSVFRQWRRRYNGEGEQPDIEGYIFKMQSSGPIRERLPDVIKAAVDSAVNLLGRDGHFDRKMVLEMAGVYRQGMDLTTGGEKLPGTEINFTLTEMSDEQLNDYLAELGRAALVISGRLYAGDADQEAEDEPDHLVI